MNWEIAAGALVLFLCLVGFFTLLFGVGRWLARRLNLRVQLRPDPPPAAPGPTWQAMVCGRRLELGDSGFYVTFDPEAGLARLYCLHTPEDEAVAWGPQLQGLKTLGEQLAKDRAEFVQTGVQPVRWVRGEVRHG